MVVSSHEALEAAKTVLEVADVAWTAIECRHHTHHPHGAEHDKDENLPSSDQQQQKLEAVRSENRRLRGLLQENLKILQSLASSPCLSKDCPPDLYARLVAAVDSERFLCQLETLHKATVNGTTNEFPFKEVTGDDLHAAEVLINIDLERPSWWVWVTDDMFPSNVEESSGIDDDNYVVVGEEHVVDGVSNFIARCILANPKSMSLTPEELQKTISKALHGVNKLEKILNIWHAGKLFYTLSTWGLALTGLYNSGILRIAAKGVHTTSKAVMRAI